MKSILKLTLIFFVLCIISGISYSQDSFEQTKKVINDLYDKTNSKDIAGGLADMDPKCVDHTPFLPDQKPGYDGFKQIFDVLLAAFPDFHQTILDVIISPDGKKASVLVNITGTNKGDFMGMKATNKKVEFLGIDNFHFENGKFTDHWGFIDDQAMMQQLGMSK